MANKYMDTALFDKAVAFAVKAHRNTERKGHNTPYVLHVMEAAGIVETMTNDMEMIVAALLHDVVEDTEYTLEDIRKEFGDRVAFFVENETERCDEGKSKKDTWKQRKTSILTKLKDAPIECKVIALGDKLSNIRAIYRDYVTKGDEVWKIFNNNDPKQIKWYYTGLKKVFKPLKGEFAYKEFSMLVSKVFSKI